MKGMLAVALFLLAFTHVAALPAQEAGSETAAPLSRAGCVEHCVLPPSLLRSVDPAYTKDARKEKVEGTVLVSLIIDEQGLPKEVTVKQGLGHGLDEEAVRAVEQYRFKPAMRDGQAIPVKMNIAVNFQIFHRF